MPLISEDRSFATHLVVPIATLQRTSGFNAFTTANTAVIWVPPAIKTGTSAAAPITNPEKAGIIGSPTQEIAFTGFFARLPKLAPDADSPARTVSVFSLCGLYGMLLLTFPSAFTPRADRTPSAVVVPPGMLSPITK